MIKNLLLIGVLIINVNSLNKVCRDPEGKEVDWYALFLYPESATDGVLKYGYYDKSRSGLIEYTYSESTFPPTRLTRYVTEKTDKKMNYFFWNDDKATKGHDGSDSVSSDRAHAKGTLVYDSSKGAFLLHSLPRYPTRTDANELLTELPGNTGLFGQTFFCISVDKSSAEKIVEYLNYINVNINLSVDKDYVNSVANKYVKKLIANVYDTSYKTSFNGDISSLAGTKFYFIGKSYLKNIIPYDTTIRDYFEDSFYVRTWTRPSVAPALCSKYNLYNVEKVKFGNAEFKDTKEHSKWAVSLNKNYACFSDLNHTPSQAKRGGHIVCVNNAALKNIMLNAVVSHDDCTTKYSLFHKFLLD